MCDQRDTENTNEQVKQYAENRAFAQYHAGLRQPECDQQNPEENADPDNQIVATPLRREASIKRQDTEQQNTLRKCRVRLNLKLCKVADVGDGKPAFTHGFDQVKGNQDQENVSHKNQARRTFPRMHVRK